jgi:stringent starvation protein B
MTPNKPYLIRAIYDWIVDNDLTPYLLVNAEYPGIQVPLSHVKSGKIILNISPLACRGLHLENDRIVFSARFGGETIQIFLLPSAVLAIYAKENGRGMEFGEEEFDAESEAKEPTNTSTPSRVSRGRANLTLVKKDKD